MTVPRMISMILGLAKILPRPISLSVPASLRANAPAARRAHPRSFEVIKYTINFCISDTRHDIYRTGRE